ncbi:MAG: PAS domain S-box protein, partial [Clostridiaceae bacterium]
MQIALNLVLNTTLLLSICIIFNLFYQKLNGQSVWYRVLGGIALGIAGIAIMTIAIRLPNSVIFDTRSILLCVSGLFYGVIPTAIAAVIIALYRLYLGGPGVLMGVAVTLASAAIGIIWRAVRKNPEKLRTSEFYLFGLLTHIVMVFSMLLLPQESILSTMRVMIIPVLAIYPLGTLAMCWIITYERRNLRTEKLLNESEIRFEKVCEQAPVGIIVGSDIAAYYVNTAYANILGMTKTEIMRLNWKTYTHPDDLDKDYKMFQQMMRGEIDRYDLVKRYIRSNGEVVRAHIYVAILDRAEPNKKSDYICIAQDITGEFAREQELQDSERRHRETSSFLSALLNSIPDHIFYKNENGVYMGANRAFELASGIPRERLVGKTDFELYDRETAMTFVEKDSQVLTQNQEVRSEETIGFP